MNCGTVLVGLLDYMLPYQESLFLPGNPITENRDIDGERDSIVTVRTFAEDFANKNFTGLYY